MADFLFLFRPFWSIVISILDYFCTFQSAFSSKFENLYLFCISINFKAHFQLILSQFTFYLHIIRSLLIHLLFFHIHQFFNLQSIHNLSAHHYFIFAQFKLFLQQFSVHLNSIHSSLFSELSNKLSLKCAKWQSRDISSFIYGLG